MDAFETKDGVLIKYLGHDQEVVVPEGIIAIGEGAFKDNKYIISVELPSSLIRIDKSAFAGCMYLSSINIPGPLTEISSPLFSSCCISTPIKNEFPQSLIDVGEEAFKNCRGLTELVFPSELASIGARAFFHCESLNKIKLSKAIKFIGFAAFASTKIKDIYYEGTFEEFCAIKTTCLPPEFGNSLLVPFSNPSSGRTNIFGPYPSVLHCQDVEDDLYYLFGELQSQDY